MALPNEIGDKKMVNNVQEDIPATEVLVEEERRSVIARLFVETGLLARPRSIKEDTLLARTGGLSSEDLGKLAEELEATGKTLNAALLSRFERECRSAASGRDDGMLQKEPPSTLRIAGTMNLSENDFQVPSRLLLVIDASKKMHDVREALKTGVEELVEKDASSGSAMTFVLLGKKRVKMKIEASRAVVPDKLLRKCSGSVDPLAELYAEMKISDKDDASEAEMVKKVAMLVADLNDVSSSDKKLVKKIAKRGKAGWEVILVVRARKKMRRIIEQMLNESHSLFFWKSDEELVQALASVASKLEDRLF